MIEAESGCSAVILAGGGSRRLGRSKAFLEVAGREILERELEATSDFNDTVIATNDPRPCVTAVLRYGWAPDREDRSGGAQPVFRLGTRSLRIVTDRVPDLGPVGGLAAGLGAARGGLCWVLSCDLPFVTPGLGRLLVRELRETERKGAPRAVIPDLEGRDQPLCAAWDADAAVMAEGCLELGRRSVRELLDGLDTRRLPEERVRRVGDPARLFLNVNTPEDLDRARRLAAPG
jgi:molybdopterin-guanine dinucleotide biosynthesis protein A